MNAKDISSLKCAVTLFWQLECIYAIWCGYLPIYLYNYLRLMLIESHLFYFLFFVSVPISGTRMVESNLWRQNRTSSRKLCCLPLILFSGWQYLHGIHGNNNKHYDFIWHRYGNQPTKWKVNFYQISTPADYVAPYKWKRKKCLNCLPCHFFFIFYFLTVYFKIFLPLFFSNK